MRVRHTYGVAVDLISQLHSFRYEISTHDRLHPPHRGRFELALGGIQLQPRRHDFWRRIDILDAHLYSRRSLRHLRGSDAQIRVQGVRFGRDGVIVLFADKGKAVASMWRGGFSRWAAIAVLFGAMQSGVAADAVAEARRNRYAWRFGT